MEKDNNKKGLYVIIIILILILTLGGYLLYDKVLHKNSKENDTIISFLTSDKLISPSSAVGSVIPKGSIFLKDGEYAYYNSEFYRFFVESEENRIISSVGTWNIRDNKLILNITKEEHALGGDINVTPAGNNLSNYTVELKDVNKTIEYTINGIDKTDDNLEYLSLILDGNEIRWYQLGGLEEYTNTSKEIAKNGYSDNYSNMKTSNNTDTNNNENQQNCTKNYSMMYSDKYIYKVVVTNNSGAKVYDSYNAESQKIVDTIEKGKEIGIVADVIDNQKESYKKFDEIKNYYYLAIDACGDPQYIKYTDVAIIDSTIVLSNKFDKTQKVYVHNDEYLFNGPGLSFETNENSKKISKGTILNINTYSRIGNAVWLFVESNEYKGWLLKEYFNSVNYPYNNMKYGSAVVLDENAGNLNIEKETNLYKYAFSNSNDDIILKIPNGEKIKYDYTTSKPGITYYHVSYNGNEGWIGINS